VGKKLFIALLIVIGILFLVFVGVGTKARDGDASAPPGGVLGALMKRAQGQSYVPLSDLHAGCLKPGGVLIVPFPTVQSSCDLNVAAGGDGIRMVRLTVTQGKVTVSAPLPDPKGGSTSNFISKDLPSGKDNGVSVAVGKDAVVISLTCLSGCRLLLGG
jgi:hypothetical protein